MKHILGILFICSSITLFGQTVIKGQIKDGETNQPLPFSNIMLQNSNVGTSANHEGVFQLEIPAGISSPKVVASFLGYKSATISLQPNKTNYDIFLKPSQTSLNEVVVTGTMKEISKLESSVPVEIITPKFFQKNPTPSLFESIGMINGVQPQLNCSVCNTGDIHINGMEGPYTMILLDGMPIVSGLSTVYGLSGIPNSLVERIEVVKGPASSLYGSEAMGGIINVITKNPSKAPLVSFDFFSSSWFEHSADASIKVKLGKVQNLLGVNYFNYQKPIDNNKDGFTDITLQNRISVFNKLNLERKNNRIASMATRFVFEDRWGGQMNWDKEWRGTDSIYGESIYTKRWEVIGVYQLPVSEKIFAQLSYNSHDQNSYYGTTSYLANQQVAFGQLYWDKQFGERHNFLFGSSFRYTFYDDNTPGTTSADTLNPKNQPAKTPLPGIFVQDELTLTSKHKLLLGYRHDYDKYHGNIHSPRVAYKWAPNRNNIIRASFGTGFRVVNLFTEDHAALSGAREVVVEEELKPEKSYNGNLNYVLNIPTESYFLGFDITGFYSYFTNKIIGDFDSSPDHIIYDNLKGNAISRGISLNTDLTFNFPLKLLAGITFMDVYQMEEDETGKLQRSNQLYAPKWSGNFVLSYTFSNNLSIDFTGKWDGPMRLPILKPIDILDTPEDESLGILDKRPEYSPWFCIANIQLIKKFRNGLEVYGGLKNIFNFTPKNPILRSHDPFDKEVDTTKPNQLTFDPSYNYASLQGIRGFLGVRYNLFEN